MKRFSSICLLLYLCILPAAAFNKDVFQLLNLDYPGLQQVKEHYANGKYEDAAQALLAYYRNRTDIINPNIDMKNLHLSNRERQWAEEALEHTFYVHDGYQPSFHYGKDINWRYWPVKDNELRWQLHRHKWFTPMGKAYRLTQEEKYAQEWVCQFMDWIKKNPLTEIDKEEYEMTNKAEVTGSAENVRFAWRPLETSHRLQDQINQFVLFLPSVSFTADFLTDFLVNYHKHALHILHNYSAEGNHLLFEAQRMIYAGAFFPEFKEAAGWRKSGIDILNREIKKQVYADGGQYELDLHYHPACIDIFYKALIMADVNGFRQEFPHSYRDTIEKMIVFYINVCYPDYSNPCFSDAKRGGKSSDLKRYKNWMRLFPKNEQIRYMATEGREGKLPENLTKGFPNSGFFTFRNGWDETATVMVMKAGPKGEWHCQPDNGTFELWFNGKNLFPDSGSYIYAGEGEVMKLRNWFRQTKVHNTLTLNNRNLETTQSVTRLWQPEGEVQVLVTENQSYKNLRHRRTVFFVESTYFIIVDEASGDATGMINLHYQLADGNVDIDEKQHTLTTRFDNESNVKLQCFAPKEIRTEKEEGWYSTAYRKRTERTAVAFNLNKNDEKTVRYITAIYPFKKQGSAPRISARIISHKPDALTVEVKINGKKSILSYTL
ncbi:heparin-sulfate lyase HepC [Phocaeicola sartorii]|uniref:heparin-sulfate lyase HepC n=1 Tax=Phocaeicola sartorii TaxID=671267 RepID=UPI001F5874B8|nr:heparin-sulfate lyase HepC [Phocaeicola sartorii]